MKNLIRQSVEDLTAYAPGEQPKVEGLIKLNTNENPYPPSPAVARALAAVSLESLRLYPDPLWSDLRARIAEINGCSPDQVFIGNGSDEILRLCMRAFTQNGGAVASFDPSYSLYPVLAAAEELEYIRLSLPDDFGWVEPPADLPASVFFLANPNAPTGVVYDSGTLEAFCRRFDGVVVLDEAYIDFSGMPNSWEWAGKLPNVVVSRTFSKSFSLAGLRFGYSLASPELTGALMKLKDSYNLNRLIQAVALAALDDLDWVRDNARRIIGTRDRTATELEKRGFRVIPSGANFLFISPPEGQAAAELFQSLRDQKILVRYFPGDRIGDYLRVSIGTDEQMGNFLKAVSDT